MNRKKSGRLIVISGPSGVGKGTVVARYLASHENVCLSISDTTRAPRAGELQGVQYHFLSTREFKQKIKGNGMLEWAKYNDNYYGTPRDYVEKMLAEGKDIILEIEVQGAMKVRHEMPGALLLFIMPPSFGALVERLCARGTEDVAGVRARLEASCTELSQAGKYDFIVVNDSVEHAAAQLDDILTCSRNMTRYNEEFIEEVYQDVKTNVNTDKEG